MPIDYRAQIADREKELEDLLAARKTGIPGNFGAIRDDLTQARRQAFGPVLGSQLQGVASQFNLSPGIEAAGMAQGEDVQRRLGTSLDELLGNKQYGAQRERVNLAYNRALDRAMSTGADRRSAEDFARTMMQDEIRRQHEGTIGDLQRKQTLRQQGIKNQAFARDQELALSQMPDPTEEYQSAVTRILTGLPTQLLTYYGLSGGFGGGNKNINTTPGPGGDPSLLTVGSKYSTGIDPMTGRRI